MDQQLQSMLMQQAIVVNQEVELSSVLVGFDSQQVFFTRSEWSETCTIAETGGVGGFFLRQIFRNSRAANVKVFGMNGAEIAEMRKPFRFIFAEIAATIGGQEVGRAKRLSWIGRNYGISVWEFLHLQFRVASSNGKISDLM